MEQEATDKQPVKVTILNQSFTLLTEGDPRDIIELAAQVDDLMTSIARKSPNLDSARVAIFACLHLADQLRSRQSELSHKVREFATMLEQAIGAEN
ncbi:MAG: cell division protein ZapA [Acidobacteriia bacterium]|nr:cell division protein ZapA [Terriglobia bacterium]